MKKSPAFQFYPMDWLSDINVARMTLEQKGAYIDLLCHCWIQGAIPANPDALAHVFRAMSRESAQQVLDCFLPGKVNDSLVHPRLEKERIKQEKFRKKARVYGRLGGLKKAQNHYVDLKRATA